MKTAFSLILLYVFINITSLTYAQSNPSEDISPGSTFKIASWSEWVGDDLYIRGPKGSKKMKNMVKIDIMNFRYSADYIYKKHIPITFFKKTESAEKPYTPIYKITIPITYKKPLILLIKSKKKINHVLYDLNDPKFQFGSYKIVNFTNTPLRVKFGSNKFTLQPKDSTSYTPKGNEKRAVGCKVGIMKESKFKIVYSNMLMRRPHKRMIMFFYSSKDQAGRSIIKSRSLVDFEQSTEP